MASHAMTDPVAVVTFAGPPKSAAPLDGEASIPETVVAAFSSIQELDTALAAHGVSVTDLASMTLNDKIYALRVYEENDGNISTGATMQSQDGI